jgi:glycosyltransferase involved in cell wall biosynthesis
MGISFIVFTRNSSKNIGGLLTHVSNVVDEIIVVDGESTDDTVAIAREHGAQVFERRPWGYPEPDRMFALGQASQEWVLFLDADETLCPALKKDLRRLVQSAETEVSAMATVRLDYTASGSPVFGLFHGEQLRIFRRNRATFKGLVHEMAQIQGKTVSLPKRYFIEHRGTSKSWRYEDKKAAFYARLESLEYKRGAIGVPHKLRRLAPFAFLPASLYFLRLGRKNDPHLNLATVIWTFRFGIFENLIWTMLLFRNDQEKKRAELIQRVGLIKLYGLD